MYTFQKIVDQIHDNGSKLMNPRSQRYQTMMEVGHSGEYAALFRGSLIRLFGEPLIDPGDALYTYLLEATDESGQHWYLSVYEGPTGPTFGARSSDVVIYQVAEYLQNSIEMTPPADFESTDYHDEYDTTTTYGCLNGIAYYYEARGAVARATTNLAEIEKAVERQQYQQALAKYGPDMCSFCEGSGKCFLCGGEGGYCPECRDGSCDSCAGTGYKQCRN